MRSSLQGRQPSQPRVTLVHLLQFSIASSPLPCYPCVPLRVCGSAGSWSLLRSRCTATTWSRPVRASRLMATTGNEPEDGGQLRQPDGFDTTGVCSLSRTPS